MFTEESIRSSERNGSAWKNEFYIKFLLQQTELRACFRLRNDSEQNSESLLLFLFHRTEFQVVFSSAEWFRTEFHVFASIFVLWYRIPSIFLPCRMVRNGIPRVLLFRGTVGIPLEQSNNNFFDGNCQPFFHFHRTVSQTLTTPGHIPVRAANLVG